MVPVLDESHVYEGAWALGWRRVFETDAWRSVTGCAPVFGRAYPGYPFSREPAAFRSELRSCVKVEVADLGSRP